MPHKIGSTPVTSPEQLQTQIPSEQQTTKQPKSGQTKPQSGQTTPQSGQTKPQSGQTKIVAHDEKKMPSTDYDKSNQPPKSILKRSARVVNKKRKKHVLFTDQVSPEGIKPKTPLADYKPHNTRSEEKEAQIELAVELFRSNSDREHKLENMLANQQINDISTKARSKRPVTFETLTKSIKSRIDSDNKKLMKIINKAEETAIAQ